VTRSAPYALNGSIVWSRIDADLSVAARGGDFAGYVDRRSIGAVLAFDSHGRHIGTFADGDAARSELGGHAQDRRGHQVVRGIQLLRGAGYRATIARLFRKRT